MTRCWQTRWMWVENMLTGCAAKSHVWNTPIQCRAQACRSRGPNAKEPLFLNSQDCQTGQLSSMNAIRREFESAPQKLPDAAVPLDEVESGLRILREAVFHRARWSFVQSARSAYHACDRDEPKIGGKSNTGGSGKSLDRYLCRSWWRANPENAPRFKQVDRASLGVTRISGQC